MEGDKMKTTKLLLAVFLAVILSLNLVSALVINSVNADTLTPGDEGVIRIEVENILDKDVKEVSLRLNFGGLPFIPIGTSEKSAEEIDDGDEEDFYFRIKAANDITPADYEIPYTLQYKVEGEEILRQSIGTIGIRVTGSPDLVFSVIAEDAVVNQAGKITFKIVNKGNTEARFVSVKFLPEDLTLLSENEVYIGTVDSDDFETTTFEVVFGQSKVRFQAVVEYKDFDNREIIKNINLELTVYTKERALELGIIKPNNSPKVLAVIVVLIVLYLGYRAIKKRQRLNKSKRK